MRDRDRETETETDRQRDREGRTSVCSLRAVLLSIKICTHMSFTRNTAVYYCITMLA